MVELVRIEHTVKERANTFVVNWQLGNKCNFSCSYCPSGLHDGSIAWTTYDCIERFCVYLMGYCSGLARSLFVTLSGGEPTAHPDFLRVASLLTEGGAKLGIISNGSRPISWWREVRHRLASVSLTYHPEFTKIDHFISVAQVISEVTRTGINIAVHPDRFHQCLDAAAQISASCTDVTMQLKPLLVDFGASLYPYSPEQLKTLANTHFEIPKTRPTGGVKGRLETSQWGGPMRKVFSDGSSQTCSAAQLLIEGINQWSGWSCAIGLELLCVDARGDIYRGKCKQGGRVGHISDSSWTLPTEPVVCCAPSCHCLADIMTTKTRLSI